MAKTTSSTMRFEAGDLVLLLFPFTDESGTKQRPALVSRDSGDEDLLVARATSQSQTTSYDVPIHGWKEAGLLARSAVRVHKLATIEKRLVKRELGTLSPSDWAAVKESLKSLW